MPRSITHDSARSEYGKVRREMRGVTDAAIRRETARRMGVDYDTFLKAWKKPTKKATPTTPSPPIPPTPTTPVPPKIQPPPAPTPAPRPVLTHETARQQAKLVKKEFPTWTDAQVRHEAARRMAVPYDEYLRHWKNAVAPTVKTPVAPRPTTPTVKSPATPVTHSPPPVAVVDKPRFSMKGQKATVSESEFTRKEWLSTNTREIIYRHPDGNDFAIITHQRRSGLSRPVILRIPGQRSVRYATVEEAEEYTRQMIKAGGDLPDHKVVNPGRFKGVDGTQNNCTSCTSAYELRRRGYDVVAGKMPTGQNLENVYKAWGVRLGNQVGVKYPWRPYASIRKMDWITEEAGKMPDGARGFITVIWRGGGAHIFNWEVRNGKMFYIDAQLGTDTKNFNDWYDRADDDIMIARVDNITETRNVEWLAYDAKDGQQDINIPWGQLSRM